MKISQIFELNKSQAELDFVDIDISGDTPLFIDPFFISIRSDNWSIEVSRTIRDFFQRVITLIRQNNLRDGKDLFRHLHEPNTTCLGMSVGAPRGRGVGTGDTDDIFDSIRNSRAVQTGLIQDIEDNLLFVDGFGRDKLSDMTTNIVTKHLIDYTREQCKLHNIPMTRDVPSGFYWNRQASQWEQQHTKMLVINDRVIILVPKGIVSFCNDYTPYKYYNHFVLNFMQNEHIQMNSALVQQRKNGARFVTKKDLKEHHPFSKDFIADFSRRNPDVLTNFKTRTKTNSVSNNEITDLNIPELCQSLIVDLQAIVSGTQDATRFHRLVTGILEIIFYPSLIYPTLELEIHDGRKRIDLTFDNAAKDGIFHRLSNTMGLPCQFIMVECKNYSTDIQNPELDQLGGRFSPNRGRVGFLVCRSFENYDLFLRRCKDTYRDDRGLIIPLSDNDMIELLNNHNEWNSDHLEVFLSDRIREIMTH
ncbi:hypothetical protein [Labilibaculum euxinus]